MQVFLVDNGSLRIESWENLVRVAAAVGQESQRSVQAASLLHSDQIRGSDVPEGIAAPQLLEVAFLRALQSGERQFLILPFFIGPSRAITVSLWKIVARLQEQFGWFEVRVARFLGCPLAEEPLDMGLAGLMVGLVKAVSPSSNASVILVDHGSPIRAVTDVRNRIALELSQLLGSSVMAASMERRDGSAYDFNEPLLATALSGMTEAPNRTIVVAMLFLSPGRHAGVDGDVATICREAAEGNGGLRIIRTALPGMDERIVPMLSRRLSAALRSL